MPNLIIDQSGMYTSTTFTGENGSWSLVGSESSGDSPYSKKKSTSWLQTSIANIVDEFLNIKTGERLITTRGKVYKAAESGAIFL